MTPPHIAAGALHLLGYAGMIYGSGAFAAVYMVDHGATAHFVFLTFVVGSVVVFFAFQVNARISEGIERRARVPVLMPKALAA